MGSNNGPFHDLIQNYMAGFFLDIEKTVLYLRMIVLLVNDCMYLIHSRRTMELMDVTSYYKIPRLT